MGINYVLAENVLGILEALILSLAAKSALYTQRKLF